MRRLTLVSGTSSKFWEVDRAGTEVNVRFGRIGTDGRRQVKDLLDETAAIAHVDTLVREKLAKGYAEGAVAVPAPSAAAEVDVRVEPAQSVDEDRWEVPATWWPRTDPIRGIGPVKSPEVNEQAPAVATALIHSIGQRFTKPLDNAATDAALREAAKRQLGGENSLLGMSERESTPLGAAVVTAWICGVSYGARDGEIGVIAEAWVVEQGVEFAVQAAMRLPDVGLRPDNRHYGAMVRVDRYLLDHDRNDLHRHVLGRLRVILAGLDDEGYARAVAVARAMRPEGFGQRATSSYLLPTEQDWVTSDIEELAAVQPDDRPKMLYASVTTQSQLTRLISLIDPAHVTSGLLWNAAAHVGPGVEPLIRALFDGNTMVAADRKRVLGILSRLPTDSAFQLMVDQLGEKGVGPALTEAMNRFPRRGMRLLAAAVDAGGNRAAEELLAEHVLNYPELRQEVPASPPAATNVLEPAVTSATPVARASEDLVPAVLRTPPWTRRADRATTVVLEKLARAVAPTLAWKSGEREQWAALSFEPVYRRSGETWPETIQEIQSRGGSGDSYWRGLAALAEAPEELVRPLLRRDDFTLPANWWGLNSLMVLLGKYGDDAVFCVSQLAVRQAQDAAPALLPVEGPAVALHFAGWLARSTSLRKVAVEWLARHPQAAARDLIPVALSKPGKDRTAAESALRQIDPAVVTRAASAYGPAAADGIAVMLAVDPLDLLPSRMPTIPGWLQPAHLPPLLLADRSGALPPDAVTNVVLMLMLCRPGQPYPGVAVVKDACDATSLSQLCWAVFERWRTAEHPSKDTWVLEGLTLCGDDDVVRELAALIGAWPGEAAYARAVAGLDVLSGIGTEVALMHLHRISEKAPSKPLRTAATEKLAEVADELGLTPEQLADRVVPDLGLDPRGAMVLDYGPRTFTIGFDEQLTPMVLDADGSRRKMLPKPSATDDQALATAAYARFSGLKKDVKTIAADQIRRMERAMVTGRRWTGQEHRRLFVEHPLLRHLARRLVWATFDGRGALTGSFRVAEDRTLASSEDDEVAVPDDAMIGIAHPLHLDAATLRAWSEVLSDYEILQPFAQLAREVFTLTPAERTALTLDRFHGATVPTGRVLGMTHKGWQRGTPSDGGMQTEIVRDIGEDRYVVVDLDPGVPAGAAMEFREQELEKVRISRGLPDGWDDGQGSLPFDVLDDIAASELLRDLEHLRG